MSTERDSRPRRASRADLLLIALGICPGCGGSLDDENHQTRIIDVVGREERPGLWRVEWSCCEMVEFIEADTETKARKRIRPDLHECRTPTKPGPVS